MNIETYSIWLQNSQHNKEITNLINRYASDGSKDGFFPHVTLVTHIVTEEKGVETLTQLSNDKCDIVFAKFSI